MKTSLFFYLRLLFAWGVGYIIFLALWNATIGSRGEFALVVLLFICIGVVVVMATSHLRRVRLISEQVSAATLANRQVRFIEVPFEASEAFAMIEGAVRELPGVLSVESARDSLQVRARIARPELYKGSKSLIGDLITHPALENNQVQATVTPREGVSSIHLVCEPEGRAWLDWFLVDDGTNLENANALTRAIVRRIAERRRQETDTIAATATEKELAVAKLGLLHAQVEPHFLYNTLGSAKYLVKSDPEKAEAMLDNLVTYLRNSLPRTESHIATLGDEVERVRAYLDILQFRMGTRLTTHIDIADSLKPAVFPAMMLQTLVENAIKHGLEPKSGGGNIWLMARASDGALSVTVADDGLGFNTLNKGTGIGLNNVRERLKLAYGGAAALTVTANFPSGVAATITLPLVGVAAASSVALPAPHSASGGTA
jgi:signal transduction histidine kinase